MEAIPLSSRSTPTGPGRFASFEYQFRVVNANDSEARRTSLTPSADIVIEKNETINANVTNRNLQEKDLYSELLKLEELRKKGILTQKEFDARKKSLLAGFQ